MIVKAWISPSLPANVMGRINAVSMLSIVGPGSLCRVTLKLLSSLLLCLLNSILWP